MLDIVMQKDTEVAAKPRRRRFTAEYRRRIVKEAEAPAGRDRSPAARERAVLVSSRQLAPPSSIRCERLPAAVPLYVR